MRSLHIDPGAQHERFRIRSRSYANGIANQSGVDGGLNGLTRRHIQVAASGHRQLHALPPGGGERRLGSIGLVEIGTDGVKIRNAVVEVRRTWLLISTVL